MLGNVSSGFKLAFSQLSGKILSLFFNFSAVFPGVKNADEISLSEFSDYKAVRRVNIL